MARDVVKVCKAFFGRGPTRAPIERVADDRLVCHRGDLLIPPQRILVHLWYAEWVTEARGVLHRAMLAALGRPARPPPAGRSGMSDFVFTPKPVPPSKRSSCSGEA